jgi:hypothetical protein
MKRALVLLFLVTGLLGAGASTATGAMSPSESVKIARLVPVNNSGVHGFVVLVATGEDSTNAFVVAFGLQPNTDYASFYYEDNACQELDDIVGTFTSNAFGVGFVSASLDDPIDDLPSFSVRTPDYSVLFACADTSG